MHIVKSVATPADTPMIAGFSRIVIGIDFGPASLSAARWATDHVALHADATLAHVVPSADTPLAGQSGPPQTIPEINGGLGGFAAMLDVDAARTMVRVGRPSHWLSALANAANASLLVLGRRADANRRLIGEPNVIERAARRTTASVLVVPEGTVDAPTHIIAAVDHGPADTAVLRIARHIARLHEATLGILHVLSPGVGTFDRVIRQSRNGNSAARSDHQAAIRVALPPDKTRWLASLERWHNVRGRDRTDIAFGDPVREIVAAATAPGTLVVVGARGADEAPRCSLGSVARELLTRAPVPVLAVAV
jgi:nucleotide-binding universal stress UspA family protein